MIELLGAIAGVLGVLGVVLNNRRLMACFPVWIMSNAISCGLHVHAAWYGPGAWTQALRDVAFLVLAVEGWWRWKRSVR